MEADTQRLIEAWLRYHEILEQSGDLRADTNVADDDFWAIIALDNLVKADPELCWHLILEIFARSSSDYQRACLAAGLLEDLLVRHGATFIECIEEVAAQGKGFRDLLSGVWRSSIDADVWERLSRAHGCKLL